ncbi:hypothetical protein PHISCL_01952 [Aspergillus sclerotialis]|uniref:DUF7702 domain-containing protein n=1 Tax=Aspergillus sclerotialis TaxID=2070753 RepID=A0A3A2ZRA9_9EURO|nr:hypothetical protein PHISCL_01952 [Aspergillus sclerotialis]
MTDSLSAAECALYAILFIPVAFLVVRHGIHGLLGWLFLAVFCTLRIIGAGMAIKDSSPAASIISNVGLSPILLAVAGILHEARTYRIHKVEQKQEWAFAIAYHIPVVVGVAITAVGSSKLQHHEQPIEKSEKLVKAGLAILAVCWGILVAWTAISFKAPKARNADRANAGTVLLGSNVPALVLIGVRVFYSVVALSTQKSYLNPTTGTLPIRVILGFLPELIATIIYVAAGLKTQGVAKLLHLDNRGDESLVYKFHAVPTA